jgi:hypothetical protein
MYRPDGTADQFSIAPVTTGDFTAKEVAQVRAALRFLRLRCGSWATHARTILNESTLS